jgi:hypothetical protein
MNRMLADLDSLDAHEKLVDRMLDQPRIARG